MLCAQRSTLEWNAMCMLQIGTEVERKNKLLREQTNVTEVAYTIHTLLASMARMVPHNLSASVANLSALLALFEKKKIIGKWNHDLMLQVERNVQNISVRLADMVQLLRSQNISQYQSENIDLFDLYRGVQEQISQEITQSGVQIRLFFWQPHTCQVRSVLENIFFNMLTNAIKYRSKCRPLRINIYSERYEAYTLLCFEDNGLGMDLQAYGDRLFGFSQRFHEKTAAGSGIGLHLLHAQIKALGGKIDVKSKKGKGSAFYLYLKE